MASRLFVGVVFYSRASFTFTDLFKQVLFGGRGAREWQASLANTPQPTDLLLRFVLLCVSVCLCVYFHVIYKLVETIFKGSINGPCGEKSPPCLLDGSEWSVTHNQNKSVHRGDELTFLISVTLLRCCFSCSFLDLSTASASSLCLQGIGLRVFSVFLSFLLAFSLSFFLS